MNKPLRFKRPHKGTYQTQIDGVEVLIDRQYYSNTWQASSSSPIYGDYISIELQYLSNVKEALQQIADSQNNHGKNGNHEIPNQYFH